MECPLQAGTVMGAGGVHLATDRGQQAKRGSTHGEHHDSQGTGCRAHRGGVPMCWRDRDTSLKEMGLSRVFQDTQELAGYAALGWCLLHQELLS